MVPGLLKKSGTELLPLRRVCVSRDLESSSQRKDVFEQWRPRSNTFNPATVTKLFKNSPRPGGGQVPLPRGDSLDWFQPGIQSHRPETLNLLTGDQSTLFLKVNTTF